MSVAPSEPGGTVLRAVRGIGINTVRKNTKTMNWGYKLPQNSPFDPPTNIVTNSKGPFAAARQRELEKG